MNISEVRFLLWKCKKDIVEGVCSGCGKFNPHKGCPDTCEHTLKIRALEKAARILNLLESLSA